VGIRVFMLAYAVALMGLAGSAQAAALPQPLAPLPPDLVALEQKLAALNVNSAHFEVREALVSQAPANAAASAIHKPAFVKASGVTSNVPSRFAFAYEFNHAKLDIRVIGKARYLYEPAVARLDGGRPWIRVSAEPSNGGLPGIWLGPITPAAPGPGAGFEKLIAQVNAGSSLTEVGPQTIDGQAVTEFTAVVELPPSPTGLLLAFGGLLQASAQLELYLAPDGLPVSTRYVVRAGGTEWTTSEDLSAINQPVVLHAPRARLTIGEAQLNAAETRRAAAQLQREKRRCKEHSRTRPAYCKIIDKPHRGAGEGTVGPGDH
jgi:hypothetical protein